MAGSRKGTATASRPSGGARGRTTRASRKSGAAAPARRRRRAAKKPAKAEVPDEAAAARRELIEIQKRVSARLKEEIRESLGPVSPAVEIYYEEYDRELQSFERLATKKELMEAVAGADIVYHGDYHTLHQSQRTLCRMLEELATARPNIILGMEMVHIRDQAQLDLYMAGETDEGTFLEAIDYERRWGFEWRNYREVLSTCRRLGIRVVGINSEPKRGADRIIERDFRTAELLAELTAEHPEALIYVFDGDLHVARDHLPLIVNTELHRRRLQRRHVIVYQNSEAIYWQLAARGLEQGANVVRVAPDSYCIINATPLERLQSYLNWQQHQDELDPVLPGWDDAEESEGHVGDYSDAVYQIVTTICEFLEIERDDLDDLTVYTTRDLDFLRHLRKTHSFKASEIAEIKRQILSSESYFIPKANIVYLADLSVNHAAEEAAHFIHAKCAGFAWEPLPPFVDFYYRIMREALGFFGSKVITHTRDTYHEPDFDEILAERPAGRLDARTRQMRTLARYVLQHRRFEQTLLSGKKPRNLRAIYTQSVDMHLAITHALGYMLGERLYVGMLAGLLSKANLRELFMESFFEHDDDAFRIYIELVHLLRPVEQLGPMSERL